MYYKHSLNYVYPEKCDEHMITVKHLRDVDLDENYPYLQKSFIFKCKRALLQVCLHTFLPVALWVRHGLKINGREKIKKYKKEIKNGIITVSNHVFMWDFIGVMLAMRPHLGYFPAWKTNLEGPNGPLIRMAGGIPIPTDSYRSMVKFKLAMEEVLKSNKWMHFFPEGSMWFYYPDIRPLKKAVFQYAVKFDRPILPITLSFRPRKGIHKLWGKTPLVDLNVGDLIYYNKEIPPFEAVKELQKQTYHIMQEMNGITPSHPAYRTNQNIDEYIKTM